MKRNDCLALACFVTALVMFIVIASLAVKRYHDSKTTELARQSKPSQTVDDIFVEKSIVETTYLVPKGSKVTASVIGDTVMISWTGIEVAEVHQYRFDNSDGKGWIISYKPQGNSVTFNPYEGDRFNLVNAKGQFPFISPEFAFANYSPLALKGVYIECSNPRGCCLQVAR